jgi:hypothetical protein
VADGGAAVAEPLGHVGRRFALGLLIPEAGNAWADGLELLMDGIPPVAVLVPPLLILRMRGGSIDFHARLILLVEVVQVPVAGLLPDANLPFRRRQAMRALHTPHVTQFEEGEGALVGITQRELDIPPPAHLRPGVHAARILAAVVRLRPMARQIQSYASSKLAADSIRSSTVCSTRVHGGIITGCRLRSRQRDRWMTTPDIFAHRAGWRSAGTVT